MKRLLTVLALAASILSIVLAVLPVSNLAIIPATGALLFGLTAFYLSKKAGQVKKIIQFTFLLTSIAITISIYKSIFDKTEVTDTQELIKKENETKEEAIEELESLDLDELEIDDLKIE